MDNQSFFKENEKVIREMGDDLELKDLTRFWFNKATAHQYSYHFTWMGLPIIQFPQDMIAMQEIIWNVKPDLIIETGVARGGSLVFYASLLELIGGPGKVIGIDIDIRPHNRVEIEKHPMFRRIELIEGPSTESSIVKQVEKKAASAQRILVCLDSNHTHDHVYAELKAYAGLVTSGSYCVVFDTVVEDLPKDWDWGERSWGVGNNPKTAVFEFLKDHPEFEIDKAIDHKLQISVVPDGYLKRK